MKKLFASMCIFAACAISGGAVYGAEWPTKSLRLIVPFPAGGSTDVLARGLATRLESQFKKPVIVENISGGATVPAVQSLMRNEADGHTMILSSATTFNLAPLMMSSVPYNPAKDLATVTVLARASNWIMVRSDRPEKSIGDLERTIAAHPGTVTIGINGLGGVAHLSLEAWKKAAKLDFTIVPYRGSPQAVTDLMGGQVVATVDVVGSTLQHLRGGKVKTLGLLQNSRSPAMKDVPAAPESGASIPPVVTYLAIAVKAGTPRERVEKLHQAIKVAAADTEYKKLMADLVMEPVLSSPADADTYLRAESVRYGKIVAASGIKYE
ncbi:hypothetical protein Tamer19_51140 [Cupriavidus sp. TA19]|uniref:Bug family tripartite tricarboxylate transporter substrate binding protein n=1 Tax=unclassified Cupriavidus TaxID=2640874 RepID=UPI000E2E89C9|nr:MULTISPECIES: tripartite tricarboxylate transporter substrate binding protein [unclassified Cupriavidus]BDB30655.1 tripartite tricarboxylate transporter substrate binding protein [Cupriavidus sp. P-10]GLC95705.1 hypothetical protein Tamer19_51140 [Cupriavidus sp. TA19]